MVSENEVLRRLFRLAAILSAVLLAVSVLSLVTSVLIVRLLSNDVVMTAVKAHSIVQYIVDYGLRIALFAVMITAAKHISSGMRANLLKIGGIVGVIGNALMMVMMLTGYVNNPHPAFEGWLALIDAFSTNPFVQLLLPRVTSVATVLCATSFVFHASGTANFTAILNIACVAALALMSLLGLVSGTFVLVRLLIGFIGRGLSIAMYTALAKYYAAEGISQDG